MNIVYLVLHAAFAYETQYPDMAQSVADLSAIQVYVPDSTIKQPGVSSDSLELASKKAAVSKADGQAGEQHSNNLAPVIVKPSEAAAAKNTSGTRTSGSSSKSSSFYRFFQNSNTLFRFNVKKTKLISSRKEQERFINKRRARNERRYRQNLSSMF